LAGLLSGYIYSGSAIGKPGFRKSGHYSETNVDGSRNRSVQVDLAPLLLRQINTNNVRVPHPRHVFVFVARMG